MNFRRKNKAHGGFTLVEVLMVIVIIGILAGLVFGIANYANEKAAVSQAETQLQQLGMVLQDYKLEYGVYPGTYSNWVNITTISLTSEYRDRLEAIGTMDPWRNVYEVKIPNLKGYELRILSRGEDRRRMGDGLNPLPQAYHDDDNLEFE